MAVLTSGEGGRATSDPLGPCPQPGVGCRRVSTASMAVWSGGWRFGVPIVCRAPTSRARSVAEILPMSVPHCLAVCRVPARRTRLVTEALSMSALRRPTASRVPASRARLVAKSLQASVHLPPHRAPDPVKQGLSIGRGPPDERSPLSCRMSSSSEQDPFSDRGPFDESPSPPHREQGSTSGRGPPGERPSAVSPCAGPPSSRASLVAGAPSNLPLGVRPKPAGGQATRPTCCPPSAVGEALAGECRARHPNFSPFSALQAGSSRYRGTGLERTSIFPAPGCIEWREGTSPVPKNAGMFTGRNAT